MKVIDSTETSNQASITFVLDQNTNAGLYKLIIDQEKQFDFIYNEEDVEIEATNSNFYKVLSL